MKQVRAKFVEGASHDAEKPDLPHATVFHALLESSLPSHEKSEERLTQEGVGLISAASETGSLVIVGTMFHLLSSADLVRRLREEISSIMPCASVSVDWLELEKLPLLVGARFCLSRVASIKKCVSRIPLH